MKIDCTLFGSKKFGGCNLIADTLDEIAKTLDYFRFELGINGLAEKDRVMIETVDKVMPYAAFTMCNPKEAISVPLSEDFILKVDPAAWDYVLSRVGKIDEKKCGGLYRFLSNGPGFPLYIPESTVNSMKKYDWDKHRVDVELLASRGEATLERLAKDVPNFIRIKGKK